MKKQLLEKFILGNTQLSNRMVMAPMTRSRADVHDAPTEMTVQYYQQRSSSGLIITEGVYPSMHGKGYARTPGIQSALQIAAWLKVTDAVHKAGGKIFLQLMHVGRIAHPLNKHSDANTVSPSPIKAEGSIFTDQKGQVEFVEPEALLLSEIPIVIEEYKQATVNAFQAGFDGVELHAASGYLPMQFLSTNTNQRQDQYGGSVINRIRFILEVLEAMSSVNGSDKIGIRIWPGSTFNDIHDANPVETYTALLKSINAFNLAYVHSILSPDKQIDSFGLVRKYFNGVSIVNSGFDFARAEEVIRSGKADLVSFGILFLTNPDLVERYRSGNTVFNTPDFNTFYTPGSKGYIDYPRI